MGFISIIKEIEADVLKGVEIFAAAGAIVAPVVTALDPPLGAAMSLVANTILQVEQMIPGTGKGVVKKQIAGHDKPKTKKKAAKK